MIDPTEPIREMASDFPLVDEGTACTQASFKANGKGFLYIGPQGGRYKAMFKLSQSLPQAEQMEAERPKDFQVGANAWVTARFSAEQPLPKRLWQKWLKESYKAATSDKKRASKKSPTTKQPKKTSTRSEVTSKKKAAKKRRPGK